MPGGWFATARAFASMSAPLVLVGGLLLRYSVIMVSPALLEHAAVTEQSLGTPTTWWAISPEDSRERGGGPGASILNRPDPIHPRSKVIKEE